MAKQSEEITALDTKCVDTIRCLSAALPNQANSGHPGAPMGCASMAHVLWSRVMKYSPKNPNWWNRDRFVLSNGHACALLYTMLHLSGYDVSLEDLKNFRQIGSKTPGHPEANHGCPGVEVTTGPLGQGISQAVGLAAAAAHMAAVYNKPGTPAPLFDNFTYTIVGDGCLQEGVSSEASTLAAHWKLGRLICLFDSNQITIDGSTNLATSEDVGSRYRAYGWDVHEVAEGDTNLTGILNAIRAAQAVTDKPSLIIVHTTIGYGSAKQGTAKVHGAPIGAEDLQACRTKFGLNSDMWHVDQEVSDVYKARTAANEQERESWEVLYQRYRDTYPADGQALDRRFALTVPADIEGFMPQYTDESPAAATRALSHATLNSLTGIIPDIVGGSADLTESNKSDIKNAKDFSPADYSGRYFRFGVREHAMTAITNGAFCYGGIRPFAATFLNFVGYAWGAARLSALSKLGVLFIATHDSIELGEDGPTHQPVEILSLIRATPNMIDFRPADGRECNAGYAAWLKHPSTPTLLALGRSNTPTIRGSSAIEAQRGAYVVQDFASAGAAKRVVLAGSGTEVAFCVAAKELLEKAHSDLAVRVVSMPSWSLFDQQSEEYKKSVLPPADANTVLLYCEASVALGAEKYGFQLVQTMNSFGASAPKNALHKHFGFTGQQVANKVLQFLGRPEV